MNKKKLRSYIQRHRTSAIGIGIVVFVIIGAIIWGVWSYTVQYTSTDYTGRATDEQKSKQRSEQSRQDNQVREAAQAALKTNDKNAAASVYRQAIAATNDTPRKIELTLDWSSLLYDSEDYAGAITTAQEASKLSKDQYLVADWLSRVYEAQKDYTNAAKYYEQAAEWADSPTNTTALSKGYYKAQVTRMDALAGGAK